MRLLLPMPVAWRPVQTPVGILVQVNADVQLLLEPAQPVPYNARLWGDRLVFGELPPAQVAVRSLEDAVTGEGWPFTFVVSDQIAPDGSVVERRIHGIVRVERHGVLVAARAKKPEAIDAFAAELRGMIVQSRVDFFDVVASLHQIWAGLELRDTADAPGDQLNPPSE